MPGKSAAPRRRAWSRWWLEGRRIRHSYLAAVSEELDQRYFGDLAENRELQIRQALALLEALWLEQDLPEPPRYLSTSRWPPEARVLDDSAIWSWDPERWEDLSCWRLDIERAVAEMPEFDQRLFRLYRELGGPDQHDPYEHRALQEIARRMGLEDERAVRDHLRRISGQIRRSTEIRS